MLDMRARESEGTEEHGCQSQSKSQPLAIIIQKLNGLYAAGNKITEHAAMPLTCDCHASFSLNTYVEQYKNSTNSLSLSPSSNHSSVSSYSMASINAFCSMSQPRIP
jgi:6-phosphogluconolactonase (cycloisomerase 2 family)